MSALSTHQSDALAERIDPTPLLVQRLESWRHATQIVLTYASNELSEQSHATSVLLKQRKSMLEPPSFSGASVAGGTAPPAERATSSNTTGISGAFRELQTRIDSLTEDSEQTAAAIKAGVIPPLETLLSDLEKHHKSLRAEGQRGIREVEKLREATVKHIESLGRSVTTASTGGASSPESKTEPYVVHRRTRAAVQEQVERENIHSERILSVQNQFASLEAHILNVIQQSLQTLDQLRTKYYQAAAGTSNSISDSFTRLQPEQEWENFTQQNRGNLVPASGYQRDPDLVTFANHSDTSAQPLVEGWLHRKGTVLKTPKPGWFVLTPAGYLHQYKSSDHAQDPTPELSLYIPDAELGGAPARNSGDLTFRVVSRDANKMFGPRHKYTFIASSYEDLAAWHNALSRVTGTTVSSSATPGALAGDVESDPGETRTASSGSVAGVGAVGAPTAVGTTGAGTGYTGATTPQSPVMRSAEAPTSQGYGSAIPDVSGVNSALGGGGVAGLAGVAGSRYGNASGAPEASQGIDAAASGVPRQQHAYSSLGAQNVGSDLPSASPQQYTSKAAELPKTGQSELGKAGFDGSGLGVGGINTGDISTGGLSSNANTSGLNASGLNTGGLNTNDVSANGLNTGNLGATAHDATSSGYGGIGANTSGFDTSASGAHPSDSGFGSGAGLGAGGLGTGAGLGAGAVGLGYYESSDKAYGASSPAGHQAGASTDLSRGPSYAGSGYHTSPTSATSGPGHRKQTSSISAQSIPHYQVSSGPSSGAGTGAFVSPAETQHDPTAFGGVPTYGGLEGDARQYSHSHQKSGDEGHHHHHLRRSGTHGKSYVPPSLNQESLTGIAGSGASSPSTPSSPALSRDQTTAAPAHHGLQQSPNLGSARFAQRDVPASSTGTTLPKEVYQPAGNVGQDTSESGPYDAPVLPTGSGIPSAGIAGHGATGPSNTGSGYGSGATGPGAVGSGLGGAAGAGAAESAVAGSYNPQASTTNAKLPTSAPGTPRRTGATDTGEFAPVITGERDAKGNVLSHTRGNDGEVYSTPLGETSPSGVSDIGSKARHDTSTHAYGSSREPFTVVNAPDTSTYEHETASRFDPASSKYGSSSTDKLAPQGAGTGAGVGAGTTSGAFTRDTAQNYGTTDTDGFSDAVEDPNQLGASSGAFPTNSSGGVGKYSAPPGFGSGVGNTGASSGGYGSSSGFANTSSNTAGDSLGGLGASGANPTSGGYAGSPTSGLDTSRGVGSSAPGNTLSGAQGGYGTSPAGVGASPSGAGISGGHGTAFGAPSGGYGTTLSGTGAGTPGGYGATQGGVGTGGYSADPAGTGSSGVYYSTGGLNAPSSGGVGAGGASGGYGAPTGGAGNTSAAGGLGSDATGAGVGAGGAAGGVGAGGLGAAALGQGGNATGLEGKLGKVGLEEKAKGAESQLPEGLQGKAKGAESQVPKDLQGKAESQLPKDLQGKASGAESNVKNVQSQANSAEKDVKDVKEGKLSGLQKLKKEFTSAFK